MSINISVINAGFTILLVCIFRLGYCIVCLRVKVKPTARPGRDGRLRDGIQLTVCGEDRHLWLAPICRI